MAADPCPPWWDKFEAEIFKTNPDFGRYCAMMTTDELEARKKYVGFEAALVENWGFERDFIRVNAPLSAVRGLLKLDLNGEIGIKAIGEIGNILKKNESVRKPHVEAILGYKKSITHKQAINPKTIRIPVSPQIALTNAPTNGRKELLNQFYKLAGNSIGVYEQLAKKEGLDDEYAAFVVGCVIIQKYLDGEIK